MGNTYWEGNGAEQSKYDELQQVGWKFTKKTEGIFHSYYRYFNDGDFPGWARGWWGGQRYGKFGLELNDNGLKAQEERVTNAILYEYQRYERSKKGGKK